MAWKRPSSTNDPQSGWMNESNTIDGSTSTFSDSNDVQDGNDTAWLEFVLDKPTKSDNVRLYGAGMDGDMTIEVYTTTWEQIYCGSINGFQWQETLFTERVITKIRTKFNNNTGEEDHAAIGECEYYKIPSGANRINSTVHLGDYREDATLAFCWNSFGGDGESIAPSNSGTIKVYKDNGTTESTAGITNTDNFDGLTGIHNCEIDLSTDVFYAAGHDYSVVLDGAVIDIETVNVVLAMFSIENRSVDISLFEKAAKLLVNKAIQNKVTGVIEYFDDDGETVIVTHTPAESESTITRAPS